MKLKLFIKGLIVGLGKIIPGVSGSLLAISLNVYDRAILAITNFFDDVIENIKFLFTLSLGIIVSIIIFSKIILYFITNYYVITMLFFIGLILGGLLIFKSNYTSNKKNLFILLISFLIIIILSSFSHSNKYVMEGNFIDYLVFFGSGIIDALATIVPGISGTALLMNIGVYEIIISTISNITDINLIITNIKILIPFGLGMVLGFILLSILISYLLKKYYSEMMAFILGVSIGSMALLVISVFRSSYTYIELMFGFLFMTMGIYIGKRFSN